MNDEVAAVGDVGGGDPEAVIVIANGRGVDYADGGGGASEGKLRWAIQGVADQRPVDQIA